MDQVDVLQARVRKTQRWLRVSLVGWTVSVAMLVVAWILSMALLSTGVRLFDALAALP